MRILFINTEDTQGGAAIVAQRLMKGLAHYYSTENHLLVKIKRAPAGSPSVRILTAPWQSFSEKIIDRLTRSAGLLYQWFPFSSHHILAAARKYKPDIIHLHNIQGGYFAVPLIRRLSKMAPLVWTLHDMWSFTGNASHAFDDESWKHLRNSRRLASTPPSIGINTGAWLLHQKKRIYAGSDLTIVTPSAWLQGLARQSPVFENKPVHQVFNGLDTSLFREQDKTSAKMKLGIPPGQKTLLFSSHFLTLKNPWKGGLDLLEILRLLNAMTTEKICFLALGNGRLDKDTKNPDSPSDSLSDSTPDSSKMAAPLFPALPNLDIRYMGYVRSEEAMADCLSAADIFIYPTRADNLPNVLVESIACGTPAITFDIGGCGEIIKHNVNGLLIPPFDHQAFAAGAWDLLQNDAKRTLLGRNGLERARTDFELRTMTERYHDIYLKILSERPLQGRTKHMI